MQIGWIIGQLGWLAAWFALSEESFIVRLIMLLAPFATVGVAIIAWIVVWATEWPGTALTIQAAIELARFIGIIVLPCLLARRWGFRVTASGPGPSHWSTRYPIRFTTLDLLLVTTAAAALLGLLSLRLPLEQLPKRGPSFWKAALFSFALVAPVFSVLPAIWVPRRAFLLLSVPLAVLLCPVVGAVCAYISAPRGIAPGATMSGGWITLFVWAYITGAAGLALILTSGVLRACGYRLRRVPADV